MQASEGLGRVEGRWRGQGRTC